MAGERGFGIAATLDPGLVREVAAAVERAGFATFWANEPAGGDGLGTLAAAAAVTSRVRLGVGVIPLDRIPAERILARTAELGLPAERLALGVGSGRAKESLALVRAGIETLRGGTEAEVVVGALGPRMCALAGEVSDGVVLNWLVPAYVPPSADLVRAAAEQSGRPRPRITGYVRVALGRAALPRLRSEAARYAGIPAYAAHFARMGVSALDTCVAGETAADIQARLAPYADVLDEVVVRAVTAEETADAYLALVEAGAPARADG